MREIYAIMGEEDSILAWCPSAKAAGAKMVELMTSGKPPRRMAIYDVPTGAKDLCAFLTDPTPFEVPTDADLGGSHDEG